MMISYASHDENHTTIEDIRAAFLRQREAWLQTNTYHALAQQVRAFTPAQAAAITKIVGFGLGKLTPTSRALAPCAEKEERSLNRALVQHAAVQTIADILQDLNGGRKVKCYVQDPVNKGIGDEFLNLIGVTPLNDPKGFLEVDGRTLVVSVNPDQPVRQVLADLQWPRAMLWNTVVEEPVVREWVEQAMDDGKVVWLRLVFIQVFITERY